MKVGIIGAGHAGIALAALLLRSAKHDVRIYSAPGHDIKISTILGSGGHLQFIDGPNREEALLRLTDAQIANSMRDITQFSDVIYNTTPITAHHRIFEEILAHERSRLRQLTYVNLGGGFSFFSHRVKQRAAGSSVNVATLHTLPYASRVDGGRVTILNYRKITEISFSSDPDYEQVSLLSSLIGGSLRLDADPLHMSLDRSSYVMHPIITIFNINRIGAGEHFHFYSDGFCRPIQDLYLRAHHERQTLARTLGYRDFPSPEVRLQNFMDTYGEDFSTITAPSSLQHRYLTEDIPYGLVPIVDLGHVFGIDMPVCRSIVDLGSAIAKSDLWDSPYRLLENSPLRDEFLRGKSIAAGAEV